VPTSEVKLQIMKSKIQGLLLVFTFILIFSDGYSQNTVNVTEAGKRILDSLSGKGLIYKTIREKPDIKLSKEQASKYLQDRYGIYNWNNPADQLRQAIGQLLYFSSNNPFDSTRYFFDSYSYDSINIPWDKFYIWDTLKVKIPVIPSPQLIFPADTLSKADTVLNISISDSLKPVTNAVAPDLQVQTGSPLASLKDTIILVARDTLYQVTSSGSKFPFRHYSWPYESDSIVAAINSLISFVENRDSSIVNFSGRSKEVTPVWLNSKKDRLIRYWLRNEYSDSVTIWIGSVSRNTLGLFLEEGVSFRRPTKQSNFSDAQLNVKTINSKSLLEVKSIPERIRYWKFRSEASFILNQASLTNWVKGGESSISMATDITGYADYNNKQLKLLSNNFARLKFGYMASGENGIRKNLDLLETNSKLNHKAFGKFDFSTTLLFKTQIAKGYNYPNDSVPVSKFMNPAILTIGLGLDYKPDKTTSLNFAPLSYKGTYVTDTLHIDQTKYGIPHNKKALHEPGASFMITNDYQPFKFLAITNRLQLFTSYIHNPQNIDIDWEMITAAKINWFMEVRINTHLIFDDDTRTLLFDKEKKPVMGSDGLQKKTARIQFKELLGFTLVFRF
jgi:hypothetical protein